MLHDVDVELLLMIMIKKNKKIIPGGVWWCRPQARTCAYTFEFDLSYFILNLIRIRQCYMILT
jgi:hypothetical protein